MAGIPHLLLLVRLNGLIRIGCQRHQSVVRRPFCGHISKTKQNRLTITNLAPLILLPDSDPHQTPSPWVGATAPFSGKRGCGPALYRSGDSLVRLDTRRTNTDYTEEILRLFHEEFRNFIN